MLETKIRFGLNRTADPIENISTANRLHEHLLAVPICTVEDPEGAIVALVYRWNNGDVSLFAGHDNMTIEMKTATA